MACATSLKVKGEAAAGARYTIFTVAERVLASIDIEEKVELTHGAKERADRGSMDLRCPSLPKAIPFVKFPERPVLVDPRQLPRRKLTTVEGRVALMHAVAHIEFTAIQLAWDLLYRFRGLPGRFYLDWLRVADEEAGHFELIRNRLRELGSDYGELPSHRGLWEVAEDTCDDLAGRLALVPRCMEARGLDVTPGMISRLEHVGDLESARILRIILHDEIGHVALGSYWFRWVCEQCGVESDREYFALMRRYLRGQLRGPHNLSLRREAGFSEYELARLDDPPRA